MENRRLSYRDKLWCAREEVKDLERLLTEAKYRLDQEYVRMGGRSWWQYIWFLLGYYV